MAYIKKIFERQEIRFILVGVANTIIGTTVMLIAYNLLGFGYWISSALNYVVGSIFSYFANKYFTFQSHQQSVKEIIYFILNIAICYFIAYGLAKPGISFLLGSMGLSSSMMDQISMITGMILFVIINYFGQKLFVFK